LHQSIPTPTTSAFAIGPLTVHFYALCIILGVAVAIWSGNKRFLANFPEGQGVVADVAIYAIPAGVIGGRLYHVITSPEIYFGASGHPAEIFKIWNGGLGIWGAIALGTCGAYIAYRARSREQGLPTFSHFADALAPGVLIAQGIGRWGNWFNGELFGRPLQAPWSLEIPRALRPFGYENFSTFHPTFLYESIWCLAIAVLLLCMRHRLPMGSIFLLYITLYSVGRFFIEGLRIDSAHSFGGFRLNQYVALIVALSAASGFTRIMRKRR
jgi:prolipoprotein diacylglyceryl transferase